MTGYKETVFIALAAWLIFSLISFLKLPFRKAFLISLIIGWMFLPVFIFKFSAFPDIDKKYFISAFLTLMCFFTEIRGHIKRPKFNIKSFDLVVLFYCVIYIITAYLNDLGLYEGFSMTLLRVMTVGIPYFIGRIYFSDTNSHKDIAIMYVYLSFLYIPLCLFEFKFSPQLNKIVYGYHQHQFIQTLREGVWRPTVFMEHGLEVALWLALATLVGCWLVRAKIINRGFNLIAIATLGMITIAGQSWGSIFLLFIGLTTLVLCHFFKMGLPFIFLFLFPSVYLINRVSDLRLEKNIIEVARQVLPLRRFRSLTFRIDQEYALVNKASERQIYGWGRFSRSRIIDNDGVDRSITDSRWIIEYGEGGLLSLIPFLLIFIFPVIGLYKVAPASLWHTKNFAPSAALAVGVAAVLNDLMLNSFCSEIHFVIIGGLCYPYISEKKGVIIGKLVTVNNNKTAEQAAPNLQPS